MAGRALKTLVRQELRKDQPNLELFAAYEPKSLINALLSCLPVPEISTQAAACLGLAVQALSKTNFEEARNIIRRIMWHMNEESGNIGWGMPLALSCCLKLVPTLAEEYAHILFSYVYDTGKADNYCDNVLLRRQCSMAVADFLSVCPNYFAIAQPALKQLSQDADSMCREIGEKLLARADFMG